MRRRKFDPHHATLIEVAYVKTGSMLKAARVVAFIHAWSVVRAELGREPSMEEYADYWHEGRASAYRHQALFREVFDRCETPAPVLDLVATGAARHDVRGLVAA